MADELAEAADAVVIGGGFYGCAIAAWLASQPGMRRVLLVERESRLMARASYNNQARVHNGYHYPRSFTTAYRSRINLPQFVRDWPAAVHRDFTKVYAVARRNSKVTARQFRKFCHEIGARLQQPGSAVTQLFEPRLVEETFIAEEYAFDASVLADSARHELAARGVGVMFNAVATQLHAAGPGRLLLRIEAGGAVRRVEARHVFNCTYSNLNQLGGDFPGTLTPLKHELAELALVEAPPALRGLGVTLMDGPFFSMMPFPARGLHTLSHVRYTPHRQWRDQVRGGPVGTGDAGDGQSRVDRMVRDASRYLPAVADSRHVTSVFEVKTVLVKSEGDDGRPILFEPCAGLPGCYSILGGKIDNIYDVIERLQAEGLK